MNRHYLDSELQQMEQSDPQLEQAALGVSRIIARITGRPLCPACEGLGWFRDEAGLTNCSCRSA